jgi:hypothetical protein
MNAVTLAIDSVLLAGIICVSAYGAKILPAGAQLPCTSDPPGTPDGPPGASACWRGPQPTWWRT